MNVKVGTGMLTRTVFEVVVYVRERPVARVEPEKAEYQRSVAVLFTVEPASMDATVGVNV